MNYIESKIAFEFETKSHNVFQTGEQEFGHGLSNVDFILRERATTVLIEVKATCSEPSDFFSDNVVAQLAAKARDTYTFFHLTASNRLPITYIVVVDFALLGKGDGQVFDRLNDKLKARLKGENGHQWKVKFIDRSVVLPLSKLGAMFPRYSARRISAR